MITMKTSHLKEYATAVSATLIMISAGNSIGWWSPTGPLLLAPESPIPITPDQGSWINSIMILSSTLSAFPAAYLADRFGRKNTMLLAAVPYIVGWLMVVFATTLWELFVARVLPGIGYGIIYTVAPMFLGEISSDEVRGSLTILITLMNKFGILLQYCIGPFVSMKVLAMINLCIPVIFLLTFVWVAESPYYYVKEGRYLAAEKALQRLRSDRNVKDELKKIEATVAEDMKNKGTVMDLVSDSTNRKALFITTSLFATQQFCGSAAVITYAQTIFAKGGGVITASNCSIIFGFVQFIIAGLTVLLVDRAGRRPLLLISSFGVFVMSFAVGAYFFCKDYLDIDMTPLGYIPVIIIVIYIISYTIGLSTVPMTVTSEVFPTTVKSSATSILQVFVGVSTFAVTKLYQVIADGFGYYVAFWIFSVCSFLGFVYICIMLPETKGKSFTLIQKQLRRDRRMSSMEASQS